MESKCCLHFLNLPQPSEDGLGRDGIWHKGEELGVWSQLPHLYSEIEKLTYFIGLL